MTDDPDGDEGVERRIARRVRERREALGFSLDRLALRARVSRAMISRVERAESSPTAGVLYRLANALGVGPGELMAAGADEVGAVVPVARAAERPIRRDPVTGFLRRPVSPAGTGSTVELAEVELPPNAKVVVGPPEGLRYDQHVLVLAGRLRLGLGGPPLDLGPGDCAHMTLSAGATFENPAGDGPAVYLVVTRREPAGPGRPPR